MTTPVSDKNDEAERERLEPGSSGSANRDAGGDFADLKRKRAENGDSLGSREVKFKAEDRRQG